MILQISAWMQYQKVDKLKSRHIYPPSKLNDYYIYTNEPGGGGGGDQEWMTGASLGRRPFGDDSLASDLSLECGGCCGKVWVAPGV